MQVDTRQKQLRDVLHTIATYPDVEPCVSLILQAALHSTAASGALFRSVGEPALLLSAGDSPDPVPDADAAAHLDAAAFDSVSGLLLYPVRSDEDLLGVLALEMSDRPDDAELDLLSALVDGLVIVVLRARAQIATVQAKRLTNALLTSSSDPLLVFEDGGRLLALNPAAQTVFQAAPGALLTQITPSDALIAFAEGRQALSEWVNGEKTYAPLRQPVTDDRDQAMGWILVLHDISQYKKLSHSQNEFIRIVSHDIRSPLTSMRGFADMMGMVGELNERQEQFIEKVLSGITQITALVENIQDAGRFDPETGFYEMSRSPCDLRDMASRIVNNHLIPAEKQALSLSLSVSDDVPIINGDSNMLERAITNLVDNAIKYTPDGGKIEVLVFTRDANLIVGVRDNGYGISPENQKQLFRRHVRLARKEHKRIKGTGLGLFIVRSVAQRHGGDAWIESTEGVGSTFFFNVPLKGANLLIPGANAG